MCFIPPREQSPQQMEKGDPPPSLCVPWKVPPSFPAHRRPQAFPGSSRVCRVWTRRHRHNRSEWRKCQLAVPGCLGSLPSVLSCNGCSGCFIGPSTGWELSLPPAPYRQTNSLQTTNCCLLAGTGNPENHGRNHFTEKPSCFTRADPDKGTVS